MRFNEPLTAWEQTSLQDYGARARVLRGRYYGWNGETRRIAKLARAPGVHTSPTCDSTATRNTDGNGVALRKAIARLKTDVDIADLHNVSTDLRRDLEFSSDGGQTWRVVASGQYRQSDFEKDTLDPVTWWATIRADLTTGVMQFRAVLHNLGPNTITSDCAVEVEQ